MGEPTTGAVSAWLAVRDEVCGVLSAVSSEQMSGAAALFADGGRRWFCAGQGRSGLVAQMAAMRLMHVGLDAHVVGEATAPSIREGDGLLILSGSGETPVTVHLARLAAGFRARLLAVTTRADSTLAALAHAVIEVPTAGTRQFGGTLFEQSALLLLDAVILDVTAGDPRAYALMQARHANLQQADHLPGVGLGKAFGVRPVALAPAVGDPPREVVRPPRSGESAGS